MSSITDFMLSRKVCDCGVLAQSLSQILSAFSFQTMSFTRRTVLMSEMTTEEINAVLATMPTMLIKATSCALREGRQTIKTPVAVRPPIERHSFCMHVEGDGNCGLTCDAACLIPGVERVLAWPAESSIMPAPVRILLDQDGWWSGSGSAYWEGASERHHIVAAAAILRSRLTNRPGIPADTIAFGHSVVREDIRFIGGFVSCKVLIITVFRCAGASTEAVGSAEMQNSEICLLWTARDGGNFEVLCRSEEGPPYLTLWYTCLPEATVARARGSRSQDAGPRPSAKRATQTIGAVPRSGQGCSTEP